MRAPIGLVGVIVGAAVVVVVVARVVVVVVVEGKPSHRGP